MQELLQKPTFEASGALLTSFCASSFSTVELNSAFNWSLNTPAAGDAKPECTPFTRPSRPMKIVAGQVFRLTGWGIFSHISIFDSSVTSSSVPGV